MDDGQFFTAVAVTGHSPFVQRSGIFFVLDLDLDLVLVQVYDACVRSPLQAAPACGRQFDIQSLGPSLFANA